MIDVASRAKNGVHIPSRWTTRREIISIFHNYLRDLKKRFTVSERWCSAHTLLTVA